MPNIFKAFTLLLQPPGLFLPFRGGLLRRLGHPGGIALRVALVPGLGEHRRPFPVRGLPGLGQKLIRLPPGVRDDESGTCIIEMPDEIVDASAATQLDNLRTILMDAGAGSGGINLF